MVTWPDDPFLYPPEEPPDASTPWRYWAKWTAGTSVIAGVLQVPWWFGLSSVAFERVHGSEWPTDPRGFVVGRLAVLAPAVIAALLAVVALLGRRPGAYRAAAYAGLAIATAWFLLAFIARPDG